MPAPTRCKQSISQTAMVAQVRTDAGVVRPSLDVLEGLGSPLLVWTSRLYLSSKHATKLTRSENVDEFSLSPIRLISGMSWRGELVAIWPSNQALQSGLVSGASMGKASADLDGCRGCIDLIVVMRYCVRGRATTNASVTGILHRGLHFNGRHVGITLQVQPAKTPCRRSPKRASTIADPLN